MDITKMIIGNNTIRSSAAHCEPGDYLISAQSCALRFKRCIASPVIILLSLISASVFAADDSVDAQDDSNPYIGVTEETRQAVTKIKNEEGAQATKTEARRKRIAKAIKEINEQAAIKNGQLNKTEQSKPDRVEQPNDKKQQDDVANNEDNDYPYVGVSEETEQIVYTIEQSELREKQHSASKSGDTRDKDKDKGKTEQSTAKVNPAPEEEKPATNAKAGSAQQKADSVTEVADQSTVTKTYYVSPQARASEKQAAVKKVKLVASAIRTKYKTAAAKSARSNSNNRPKPGEISKISKEKQAANAAKIAALIKEAKTAKTARDAQANKKTVVIKKSTQPHSNSRPKPGEASKISKEKQAANAAKIAKLIKEAKAAKTVKDAQASKKTAAVKNAQPHSNNRPKPSETSKISKEKQAAKNAKLVNETKAAKTTRDTANAITLARIKRAEESVRIAEEKARIAEAKAKAAEESANTAEKNARQLKAAQKTQESAHITENPDNEKTSEKEDKTASDDGYPYTGVSKETAEKVARIDKLQTQEKPSTTEHNVENDATALTPPETASLERNFWKTSIAKSPADRVNFECIMESKPVFFFDGESNTTLKLVMTKEHLYAVTDSNIDSSYTNTGISIDNSAKYEFHDVIRKTNAVFPNFTRKNLDSMLKGYSATVTLGFWPTWPKSHTRSITVSLYGFQKAYNKLSRCKAL